MQFAPGRGIENEAELRDEAAVATRAFAHQLPEIRNILVTDLAAAFSGDPAATSVSEILLCYRGVNAIVHHRLAHAIYRLGVPVVPRLIADIAHEATGVDIHRGAQIGGSFFIDHGTGVVIGETAIVGEHDRLYQAVTLGAKRFPTDVAGALIKGEPRHPIIEDHVVIYAGATVLGRITVGRNSSIGGNVWLTHSVPPDSNVPAKPSIRVLTTDPEATDRAPRPPIEKERGSPFVPGAVAHSLCADSAWRRRCGPRSRRVCSDCARGRRRDFHCFATEGAAPFKQGNGG
jgi:serine O-acetyltransferase